MNFDLLFDDGHLIFINTSTGRRCPAEIDGKVYWGVEVPQWDHSYKTEISPGTFNIGCLHPLSPGGMTEECLKDARASQSKLARTRFCTLQKLAYRGEPVLHYWALVNKEGKEFATVHFDTRENGNPVAFAITSNSYWHQCRFLAVTSGPIPFKTIKMGMWAKFPYPEGYSHPPRW